jgi:hypothetical protein
LSILTWGSSQAAIWADAANLEDNLGFWGKSFLTCEKIGLM